MTSMVASELSVRALTVSNGFIPLHDISRKQPDLVRTELSGWDTTNRKVAQTYRLASRFLERQVEK